MEPNQYSGQPTQYPSQPNRQYAQPNQHSGQPNPHYAQSNQYPAQPSLANAAFTSTPSRASSGNANLALASLIVGIVSLPLSLLAGLFAFPVGIAGLVLGIIARAQNKDQQTQIKKKATIGIILSAVAMVLSIISPFLFAGLLFLFL